MHVQAMIRTHPHVQGDASDALIRCIEECYDCAQACTTCADACLGEDTVQQPIQCIRLNLDCADVCVATGSLASRRSGSDEQILRQMLSVCAAACRVCGDECEKHADHHEHCRVCAEACRNCEQACTEAMQDVAA